MEIVIISALAMVLVFLAFIAGLHYGSKVRKNEVIEIPSPVKAIKEHKVNKQKDLEQQIEEINLYNIDSYDGTELGQKEFPNN